MRLMDLFIWLPDKFWERFHTWLSIHFFSFFWLFVESSCFLFLRQMTRYVTERHKTKNRSQVYYLACKLNLEKIVRFRESYFYCNRLNTLSASLDDCSIFEWKCAGLAQTIRVNNLFITLKPSWSAQNMQFNYVILESVIMFRCVNEHS